MAHKFQVGDIIVSFGWIDPRRVVRVGDGWFEEEDVAGSIGTVMLDTFGEWQMADEYERARWQELIDLETARMVAWRVEDE